MPFTRPWTNQEDRWLKRNWKARTDERIAADLNRSPGAVKRRRVTMRLVGHRHIQKMWGAGELMQLHRLADKGLKPVAIAKRIGRSFWSTYMAMRREGLA